MISPENKVDVLRKVYALAHRDKDLLSSILDNKMKLMVKEELDDELYEDLKIN